MMPELRVATVESPRMPTASRPLRLLIFAVLALAAAALLWVLFGTLRSAIAMWRDLRDLPGWMQITIAAIVVVVAFALAWIGRRILHPRPRKLAPVMAPTRAQVDQRVARLNERRADTAELQTELEELDRRARSEEFYVAVFGEISAGKSSLVRTLASSALVADATAQIDVLGGTTRSVAHYHGSLDGTALVFADVPGTHEASGAMREQLARDEALRAHVVLYVCAGDLTRDQDTELRWLRGFGKPLLLVLNKADQFSDNERAALESALRERYRDVTDAQLVVSAGGSETFERQLTDGRREQVRRERVPEVAALRTWLSRLAKRGADTFEPARQAAVLTAVGARADTLEGAARERDAEAIVAKYTKRAVVGAMAAVLPGSDLVIQGVLATALIRELGKLYDVPLRDLDIDAFLGQVKLTVRTSTSLVLAIAGNALKAFPGLGTLGGGVLHAIAYGLIFDSLGHAVATTLRDQRALDGAQASASLARLLADTSAERLRRIAAMALSPRQEDN
jgi:GTP-binding protein EngB required for normal cell division